MTDQPVFVRTASKADLPAIRELLVTTWHDTYDALYGVEKVREITDDWHSLANLERKLTIPQSEFIVADDGARILGMAFAIQDKNTVYLHQLYVLPDAHGKGVGSQLLQEVFYCFYNAEKISLEVDPGNIKAVAFYERNGFVKAGERHIDEIGRLIYAIPVETPAEEIGVGAATGFFYDMLKARRDRLQTVANSALPGSLWWVVVAGTGMIICLSMLMRIDNTKLDIAINVLMSVLTGSILGFIISMDNPYRGELSVPVNSYEIIYERQMSGESS